MGQQLPPTCTRTDKSRLDGWLRVEEPQNFPTSLLE